MTISLLCFYLSSVPRQNPAQTPQWCPSVCSWGEREGRRSLQGTWEDGELLAYSHQMSWATRWCFARPLIIGIWPHHCAEWFNLLRSSLGADNLPIMTDLKLENGHAHFKNSLFITPYILIIFWKHFKRHHSGSQSKINMTWIYPEQVGWSPGTRHLAFFFSYTKLHTVKQYITVYILILQPPSTYESLNRILMWLISHVCIDIWKSSVSILWVLKRPKVVSLKWPGICTELTPAIYLWPAGKTNKWCHAVINRLQKAEAWTEVWLKTPWKRRCRSAALLLIMICCSTSVSGSKPTTANFTRLKLGHGRHIWLWNQVSDHSVHEKGCQPLISI